MPEHLMKIESVMNPDVLTAERSTPTIDAVGKMAGIGAGSIVITEGRKPVGIFTERDLLNLIGTRPDGIGSTTLDDVMTSRIETISFDSSVETAHKKMLKGNFRHLLVVDRGNLVGIVSIKDLTRVREKLLERRVEQKTAEIARVRDRLHESLLRIEREMAVAGSFQTKLIMQEYPGPKHITASHIYEQAESLGGDYFEILRKNKDTLVVLMVDVMGHGITSALMAIVLKMYFTNHLKKFDTPGGLITFMNHELSSLIPEAYFAAGFCGFIDTRTFDMVYTHFGLPLPGLMRRATHNYEPIPPDAVPIGIYPETQYPDKMLKIEPGDCMLLFTDGCTEQKNPDHQMIGSNLFIHELKNNCGREGGAVVDSLYRFIREYADGAPITDDISILLLEFGDKPA